MKKQITSLCLLLLALLPAAKAQTLMTVGGQDVDQKEYLRVYQKNLDPSNPNNYTQAKLDSFTNLYSLFLMKLQEARAQKIDTTAAFRQEIENYKNQLAGKFAKENPYLDSLIREAYERMKSEWNISHILFKNGTTGILDTTAALAKVEEIKTKVKSGELSFADAANKYSEDSYSNTTGGKIGWMTAMQTPYDFESAVANTQVGQISKPCYSKFGMHIVMVNDKRPNFGKIKVAQILINAYNGTPDIVSEAKTKADKIYADLKAGKIDFEEAVATYSEDKITNQNKGEMNWFGPGENVDIFEDACLALKIGEITEPIHTDFGFHIVKKLDQKPLESFEYREPILRSSVQSSDRGMIARKHELDAKIELLNVEQNQEAFSKAIESKDSTQIISGPITDADRKTVIFSIEGQKYTMADYLQNYREQYANINQHSTTKYYNFYGSYLNREMQAHYVDYLMSNNADYQNLYKDYEDGLLIFGLMENNVWQKASRDTNGLKKYYDQHKDEYTWNNAVEYDFYTSSSKESLQKLVQTLGKINSDPLEAVNMVNEQFPKSPISLQHRTTEIEKLPETVQEPLKSGKTSPIVELGGNFQMYIPLKYTPGISVKTYEEAKSYVISDYQTKLDKDWNSSLRAKYPVKINEKVYTKLYRK